MVDAMQIRSVSCTLYNSIRGERCNHRSGRHVLALILCLKPKERQDLVDTFQTNPTIRVALLGLTAAGIGITLTAASRCEVIGLCTCFRTIPRKQIIRGLELTLPLLPTANSFPTFLQFSPYMYTDEYD